jgi:hypothetical protein
MTQVKKYWSRISLAQARGTNEFWWKKMSNGVNTNSNLEKKLKDTLRSQERAIIKQHEIAWEIEKWLQHRQIVRPLVCNKDHCENQQQKDHFIL